MSADTSDSKVPPDAPNPGRRPGAGALGYVLRLAGLVFATELIVMVALAVQPVRAPLFHILIDSVALVVVLIPGFYALVYRPLLREAGLRVEAEEELRMANRRLEDYARNLKEEVKEKAQRLAETGARFTAMLENSIDIIVICDARMEITFWNRVAEEAFGYARDEALGMSVTELVPPDRREEFDAAFSSAVASDGGKALRAYEAEALRKNGITFPVEVSAFFYNIGGGIFASAIIRDITSRKAAYRKIRDQLERIRALRAVDTAISSTLDLGVVLDMVLDQVVLNLKVDAADILLFNPETSRLEFSEGRGFRTDALRYTRLLVGEGYSGRAAAEARVVCIEDMLADGGELRNAREFMQEGFIFCCCIPLMAKGKVKGVLEVFHRSRLRPDTEFMDFVKSLALQSAIAIDNAELVKDLHRSNMEMNVAYETTIEGWSRALDMRDKETEGHSRRVTETTVRVAREMGMSEEDLVHVRRGALLHDIGKMGIPDAILLKPGKLDPGEWDVMRRHPVYAYELLSPIKYLRAALDIPYCHHEKWDGTGYPRGIKGEEIPLEARIFAVIDAWDALNSDRPYRPAWPEKRVREYLAEKSGADYDPRVVEIFLAIDW